MLRQLVENLNHRLVEVDPDHVLGELLLVDLRHVFRGIGFQLFDEDAVAGDLAERLAVGGAGHADADRQRSAVAGQANDTHVMAEILAAELRADAGRLRRLVDFGLHREIAEGVAVFRAFGRQRVEIARRGELDRLQVHLGRSCRR